MSVETEAEILTAHAAGVMTLTLNRPKVLNALTGGMMRGLLESLKSAEKSSEIRCVVLTAAGRAFCAGADLGDLKKRQAQGDFSLGGELRSLFNPLVSQIRRMEKPVIGVANGLAAGAGASLVLSCDIKLAAEEASFICAFVKVGLVPDSGMTAMLARHLGLFRALEHSWTAKPITAAQALACGLVNEVMPAYRLEGAALALAGQLASGPPKALALTKRALNRAWERHWDDQLEYEAQLQDILGRTRDHSEGVAAFLEKRPPRFTGE